MNLGYGWSVEAGAYRYLVSLPTRRRRLLERAIESIASHPFQTPLITDRTTEGSQLEIIEFQGYLFTYNVDHAIRQIHVVEIHPSS